METKFTQFLRTGGSAEFFIRRKADVWVGGRTALSIKSEFPNYAALRDNFAARLDAVIQSNSAMLLQAISAQYDPPLTAAELPGVSAARADTLALWEERIEAIWTEWHSHLQRLRPIREVMEQHLLRGFAALINELRQRDLGILQYVWRSRDDGKVRSSHAQYDDQVFSWDNPPEGGHPGQAFNCRCHAEPFVQDQVATSPQNWDGFAFRYGDADRDQMRRNAEAEMRALRPAIEALAALSDKTADQEAQQRALAEAFRAAAYRYELASREPGALARSGLLFGPDTDRTRLIAEAEAYRKGADEMARGMSASPFFDGIHPAVVVSELRRDAPESAGQFLNSLVLMAGVKYLPQGLVSEDERFAALRDIGRGFVAAARAVEQERDQRGIYDTAQWNALSADLQRIAGQGVSAADARAVNDGMLIETGRRFYPDALALVTGGLFSVIGAAARAPIRITPGILDDTGRFLGQRSGGPNAPSFRNWSVKPGNYVEIMPGGQVRYTTTITDPASSLNGRTVSVSYTDGVPDFSQIGVARVDIPNPVGRGVGADTADMRAASRALWAEIEAGRIDARRFTEVQLDDIRSGKAQITGLTWHHDGISLNQDGTGPMLLLDRRAHIIFGHVGWASTINP
ncbi:phage minor head protein [Tabrizicola sp.]|uniref:phage minor head protein n=1 Tax=Tabrizicola sp. TaxID=2005166 RepID=UPI002736CE8B|nr:phage minor head protein [Tabrizicola sp.]MDP3198020.1 phage minor head protein [Tabrizicola sp.]